VAILPAEVGVILVELEATAEAVVTTTTTHQGRIGTTVPIGRDSIRHQTPRVKTPIRHVDSHRGARMLSAFLGLPRQSRPSQN